MVVLIGWCWFAAAVLIVSLAVHLSTFLGIDPIGKWPGVMFIHLAIFPPFLAALYYGSRTCSKGSRNLDPVWDSAPRWLRILTGAFFAYVFVNFASFIVLSEGGGPHERDGKYLLQNHGRVLRELSEAEYHQHQAYVVRGFSGHWMLFSSGALTILVGAAKLRQGTAAPTTASVLERANSAEETELLPERTSAGAGLVSLLVYVACLALILSGQPALSLVALLPVTTAMVLAVRRRRGFPHRAFESRIGCLTLFPNFLIAGRMGRLVAEFIYIVIYEGIGTAWSHEVGVTFPKGGPSQLSNGELLNNRAWGGLMFFVIFPVVIVGTIGLTYLAEHVGRLVEVRRREKDSGSQT